MYSYVHIRTEGHKNCADTAFSDTCRSCGSYALNLISHDTRSSVSQRSKALRYLSKCAAFSLGGR